MDIRRLQAFCKVYEFKSFSKAGEALLLSQPTISAHVMSLENELGAKLFDRLGRSVLPTAAAEMLYPHAQDIFASLEHAKAEILALKDRVSGEIHVGGSTIPAHYLLPDIIAGFRTAHPEATINLVVGDSSEIGEKVLDGELSIGLVGAPMAHHDLICDPVMDDSLIVIASPGLKTPAGGDLKDKPNKGLFSSLPWVARESGSGTWRAFDSALSGLGLSVRDLNVAVKADSTLGVLQCVRAGLGLSATSRLAAEELLARGELVQVDIPGLVMERSFYRVMHAKRHVYPALERFSAYVERQTLN